MESERYYTELGIKINKLRISVRFPRWLRKDATESETTSSDRRHDEGAEPYWEFRQVSKDGLFLVCTPITTCAAGEASASASRTTSTTESLTSSSHSSVSVSSVCPPPPPVPPKSSPATLAMKPMRPPYPSSTVSKRNAKALKKSSYV